MPTYPSSLDVANNKKMLLAAFFGHHKCGSSWVSGIVREIAELAKLHVGEVSNPYMFESDLGQYCNHRNIECLAYTNANYRYVCDLEFASAIHVIRDPRDMCVSAYFSHLHSHTTNGWPELLEHRQRLRQLSLEEGLIADMAFNRQFLNDVGSWDYRDSRILEFKYEDIIEDQARGLVSAALAHFNIATLVSSDLVESVIESRMFRRRSGGRERGDEDLRSHYRRGMAGDWRRFFNTRHIDAFKTDYNWVLLATGYETGDSW